MEIGTMSAQELAESFSKGQNQNQNQVFFSNNQIEQKVVNQQFEGLTSEQIAEKADELVKQTDNQNDGAKTPEELEAEKEAKRVQAELDSKKSGRPKTKLDDSFKQGLDKLFKEQKLDPYSDGKDGYVIPETWEDVVELLEDNKKNWIDSSKAKDEQELMDRIYSSKSPAWQFVIQNSHLFNDPSELIPLLTAVQNIEYGKSLDTSEPEDQEKIVRATLSLQGLSAVDIESEIEDLKDRDRLEDRSKALKPILDRYNQANASKILEEKQAEEQKKATFWNNYYKNLEDNIFRAKDVDGVKIKNEHKQLIASALIPDEDIGGLPIYTIIDNLVAAGNFKLLSKIALLGVDEKLFDSYFLTKKADMKADGIQRVLRQVGTSSNTTDVDTDGETKPKPMNKSSYGWFV